MDARLADQPHSAKNAATDIPLTAQQFYCHDPLLVLLKDTWRLNDLWISIAVLVLPGGVFLFWWLAWASHVSFWRAENTLSMLLQTFVLFPLLFTIYVLIPGSCASLFNKLRTNGVLGKPRQQPESATYEDVVPQLMRWMDRPWWTVAILVIVLLAVILTNWLFSLFTIQVKPLHPDGSGGLGALERLLWLSVLMMLWDALLLAAALLSNNLHWLAPLELFLLGAIYVALTRALLIGWLLFPHHVMVKAREEALGPLAEAFQQALLQSLSSSEPDMQTLVVQTRRLTALKQRYDVVRETFPTWPIEIRAFLRVIVTVTVPALLPLVLPPLAALLWRLAHMLSLF